MSSKIKADLILKIIPFPLLALAAEPVLVLLRETVWVPTAALARTFASSGLLSPLLSLFRFSQVPSDMMIVALGSMRPLGVAVAGLPGSLLHLALPAFYLEPTQVACGAAASAIIPKGGAVIGHLFVGTLVDSLLLVIGTAIIKFGLRDRSILEWRQLRLRSLILAELGILIQMQAAWSIVSAFHRFRVVEDIGGNFLVGAIFSAGSREYAWMLYDFLPTAIPLLIITVVLVAALLVWRVLNRFLRIARRETRCVDARNGSIRRRALLPLAQVAIVLFAQGYPPYFGLAKTSMLGVARPSSVCARAARDYFGSASVSARLQEMPQQVSFAQAQPSVTPMATLTRTPAPTLSPAPTRTPFPTVRLMHAGDRFQFLIDGKPTLLLGINYNVDYTALPISTQVSRHTQDFQILASHGFRVVTGWGIFNEATLDTAAKLGVKVVMPIDLDPKSVYGNASFRTQSIAKLRDTVARFQSSPSVIMWNPGGDEFLANLEDDLIKRGVGEEEQKTVLQDATEVLVEMAWLANRNDPHARPSVIKQVQDWHLAYLGRALEKARSAGKDPSTFLVYGADVYGWPDYIAPILKRVELAAQGLGVAWLVTEFGPVGTGQANRAEGYVDAYRLIRQTSSLGALVYVFAPDLPDAALARPLSFFTSSIRQRTSRKGNSSPLTRRWMTWETK